jgi:catechol 2,3-dioxygenase-like lactoylglutathione lyase family enzyme
MFLEHVNLTVADLDRSIAFYCDLLGFHVRWRGKTTDGTDAAHVGDDRCYLALFQARQSGSPDSDYERVGINHFGFVVDDLDLARSRLTDAGVKPHFEPSYEPGHRLYFFDPDGIEVELVQYAAATDH